MLLSENIKTHRESAGLTQKQLAEAAGISQPYLCQLERSLKTPTVPMAVKISKALGIKLSELITDEN